MIPCLAFAGSPLDSWRLVQAGYGGGGRFTVLASDPADPSRILAGSDVAGYFLSSDAGSSFQPRGKELPGLAVSALAFHPERPGVVAIQCDKGLVLSRDSGRTGKLLSEKAGYGARFFGTRLLVFLGPDLLAATESRGVFSLKWDKGPAKETLVPGLDGIKVNSLALYDREVYAATDKGMFRLENNRFIPAGAGLPPRGRMVDAVADPASGLFAVERDGGLFRFDPSRMAWTKPGPAPTKLGAKPLSFKAAALDPAHPGVVFLATEPEYWPSMLFVSRDSGAAWERAESFTLAPDSPRNWAKGLESVEALSFVPRSGATFLADWWNLWRDPAGGVNFTQIHKGLQNTVVNGVARHPAHPERILQATADNGLMLSEDNGATWNRSMADLPDGDAMAVRFSKNDPTKAYALLLPWHKPKSDDSVTFLLCKSLDAGRTWRKLPFSVAAKKLQGGHADGKPSVLAIDPRNEDVVYVGANGHGLYRANTLLLAEGKTREAIENLTIGLLHPNFQNPDSLLIAPDNPNKLYASTLGGGIWISENAGRTWLPSTPRFTFTFGLAADPTKPGRVFAGLPEKRLLATEDGGRNWREIVLPGARPQHISVQVVAVDPARPERVFAGASAYDLKPADGLYVSLDSGKTFAPVPWDLPRCNILAFSPGPGGLLIGGNGFGLLRLEDKP